METKQTAYQRRDALLARMGYPSYSAYLASGLWGVIRRRILKRSKGVCEVCGKNPSVQVHHRSYTWGAISGKRDEFLVATCRSCHTEAEFEEGRKTTHHRANSRMNAAARAAGRTLVGICSKCHKNPPRRGRTVCRTCARAVA